MKSTSRLFAVVKSERFLTPGNPTGLTGLLTHPAPRSQLIYIYSSTLDKLSKIPEHSVYRQSTEAITKQRLSIIKGFKPPGYEEWEQRAKQKIQEHPNVFGKDAEPSSVFMSAQLTQEKDQRELQWDNRKQPAGLEGTRTAEERTHASGVATKAAYNPEADLVQWEQEPPLEASQREKTALIDVIRIGEIEDQIGAGLIEEIIQVAEGESQLVDTILEAKSWEELEEKPPQGQWDYFSRDQHIRSGEHMQEQSYTKPNGSGVQRSANPASTVDSQREQSTIPSEEEATFDPFSQQKSAVYDKSTSVIRESPRDEERTDTNGEADMATMGPRSGEWSPWLQSTFRRLFGEGLGRMPDPPDPEGRGSFFQLVVK
ncbi:MAG: hypothetical protein Q9169_005817 [Polycauliona sp. 2 TL-2023]